MCVNRSFRHFVVQTVTLVCLATLAHPQQFSNYDRQRAKDMLQVVANDVRKHYYDPKLHGVDWNARVLEAKQKIEKDQNLNMAMSHIAEVLAALDDSHTFFLPPRHAYRHDYGWRFQMIGDRCFVTEVRPQSDAEKKGVKPGDEILGINGYPPNRQDLWHILYVFQILRPQASLQIDLLNPAGNRRQLDVVAEVRETTRVKNLTAGGDDIWDAIREEENAQHLRRARYVEKGDGLMILKLPIFLFSNSEVESMVAKARKHKALILDLRGNPGGSEENLKYLLGGMFGSDVKVADRVEREASKPVAAKAWHNAFTGKLVVLVDSRSASASELFARVIQLEKRGLVMGDHTSGAVMEAKSYAYQTGASTLAFYGASITSADLLMVDGKSLEHTGVTPDETILPTPADLLNGRDPVTARAAESLGVNMTAEEAGALFPYEWPKD